jgi:hypothetical protein
VGLKEVCCYGVYWTELAQDGIDWRSAVNMVFNELCSIKGEFMDYLTDNQLPKKNSLHEI